MVKMVFSGSSLPVWFSTDPGSLDGNLLVKEGITLPATIILS
jgi:hypothetical protein